MRAKHKAFRLGLTGGMGCGKSTVAGLLAGMGATVLDADAISRELTAPGGASLPAIRVHFGPEVFRSDGSLNRAALATRIFQDTKERRALEEIIHPTVQSELIARIEAAEKAGARLLVLDVPLLFECGLDVLCDQVWVVTLPQDVQLLRIQARDGISREQAMTRIASQMPLAEKERRAHRVIDNNTSPAYLSADLERLYKGLIRSIGHA
ncbi:MAG: dephospho-CoA kinase [Candidatus Excrementavichristensenella sp.]|jgi:dephospho-CoA kinase